MRENTSATLNRAQAYPRPGPIAGRSQQPSPSEAREPSPATRRQPTTPDARGSPTTTTSRPGGRLVDRKTGGVLLSRALASQVPSALRGLTALFGMGRGVSL